MRHSPRFLALVARARTAVEEVSVRDLKRRLRAGEPLVLVDVREDHEWEAGRIAGAVHIGKGVLERDVERALPDTRASIILYCGGGYRSVLAADVLRRMGYRSVASLAGGWKAWRRSRGKTERP
jgi:rhodanese-related sulfurtransferase